MRKPRISFFIDKWHPGSGTENQLQGLISHLAPDHIDARLFTLNQPLAPEYRELFPCPTEYLGVRKLVSPGSLLRLPGILTSLRREKPDVAMLYFVDTNLFMVPVCRMAGVGPIVVNRRDMGYWYGDGSLKKLNNINRWATHCLVNAGAVKEQVVRHETFTANQIEIIPNGSWDGKYRKWADVADTLEPIPGVPDDAPTVGITASLREVKRLDKFLGMAAIVSRKIPEARFVVAGQGALRASLESMAYGLGLDDKVVFLGQVRNVAALLKRLTVAVLTSESEGLSNSLVEYGLAGVPTVAFDVGGNGEVIRQGSTGFLVPGGDVDTMADRVIELLDNSELRASVGQEARRHCEATFAPARVRDLYLDYFTRIMGLRGGGA